MIVVHHTHKVKFNQDGEVIFEGDNAVFGSQFLRAYPDHIFMIGVQKNSDIRELKCSTQRSGTIEADIKMKLVQPDPLYFDTLDEVPSGIVYDKWKEKILIYLKGTSTSSAHAGEIKKAIGIPRSSFYTVVAKMIEEKDIFKDGVGRSTMYRVIS